MCSKRACVWMCQSQISCIDANYGDNDKSGVGSRWWFSTKTTVYCSFVPTLNWCSSACTDRLQNYYRMFIHRYTHTEISEHRPTAIKATHIELCSSCGRRRLILHLIQNCNKWFYYRNDLLPQTSVVQIYIYIWNFQRESSNEWPSALRHRRIVVSNYLRAMQYVDACQRGSECAVVVMQ